MRLSTMTKVTFAVAAGLSVAGASVWAQNLKVMGTTTGLGGAEFSPRLTVRGPITMLSPDSTNIYNIELGRTNEDKRWHSWAFWHMNEAYGQDALQLWEYHADAKGQTCGEGAGEDAMCAPRLVVRKGGNVGIGVYAPDYKLAVGGAIAAANSDLYFTDTKHFHTNRSDVVGYAAIENAEDFGMLMILGRMDASYVRRVGVWDHLKVHGAIEAGNSDLYFTNPQHRHTAFGNTMGYAAIENAANSEFGDGYGTLMILGRTTPVPGSPHVIRRVDLWDYLVVNGALRVTGSLQAEGPVTTGPLLVNGQLRSTEGTVIYKLHPNCGDPAITLATTCMYCSEKHPNGEGGWWCGRNDIASNIPIGRLIAM